MSETDTAIGLELGTMAAYATLPNMLTIDHEIGWGLHIINSGAEVWPGNDEPITEEVIENHNAAWVVQVLDGIILRRRHARTQFKDTNPFLVETMKTIDSLFADSFYRRDIRFGRAITNKWLHNAYETEDWTEAKGLENIALYVIKRAPHLTELVEKLSAKVCEVYNARGTETKKAVRLDEVIDKIEQVDFSEVPPPHIEVIDGQLVEPNVKNLGDILDTAGVESFNHDFPYYATFRIENGKEVLKNLLEDIVQLRLVT